MLLLVGGYTLDMGPEVPGRARGISAYDCSDQDGSLTLRGEVEAINPSYLTVDSRLKVVYAVRECTKKDGAGVAAYRIKRESGQRIHFELLSDHGLAGDHPCHLTIAERSLIVSSYTSGTIHVFSLTEEGAIEGLIQEVDINTARGESHAHCAAYDPLHSRVYVCDLGADKVVAFDRSPDGKLHYLPKADLLFPEGAGPRHIVLSSDGQNGFVNCELKGLLYLLRLSDAGPAIVDQTLYLPERACPDASGAALRLAPSGRDVYVSDRTFSLITALKFDPSKSKVKFRDTYPSGGERPRDFDLSPDGQWLLAANTKDHKLATFKVGPKGGLNLYQVTTQVPSPTSVAWLQI